MDDNLTYEEREERDAPREKDLRDPSETDVEATRVFPAPASAGFNSGFSGVNGLPTTLPGLVLEETEGIASGDTEPEWNYHPSEAALREFAAPDQPSNPEMNNDYDKAKAAENTPGVKTGGYANDGSPDTRGVTEKIADAVTGDNVDDKTGKRVDGPGKPQYQTDTPGTAAVNGTDQGSSGNPAPGVQTGGYARDGSPDTRGITEKIADTLSGDRIDDKTGKRID